MTKETVFSSVRLVLSRIWRSSSSGLRRRRRRRRTRSLRALAQGWRGRGVQHASTDKHASERVREETQRGKKKQNATFQDGNIIPE